MGVASSARIDAITAGSDIDSLSGAQQKHLLKKGVAALLDQLFFACGNLLTTIVLARWLSKTDYGAFSVVQSWFFLLANAHGALVTEPLMVFGTSMEPSQFRGYSKRVLSGHWLLTGLFSAGLAVASAVLWNAGSSAMAPALLAAVVATPLILLGWLVRRTCHLKFEFRRAAAGSAFSSVLILAGLFAASKRGIVSAPVAFLIMGLAGLVSWTVIAWLQNLNSKGSAEFVPRGPVFARHWNFGRWSLLAEGLSWITGEIWSVVVPIFLGLPALAAVAAAGNLFKPLHPLNQSISNLLLPLLSRTGRPGEEGGWHNPVRLTYAFLALVTGVTILYGIAVAALARPIFGLLYGGRYSPDGLMWPFVAAYTASAVNLVPSCAIKSSGDTKSLFRAWIAPSLLVLVLAVPAIRIWGLSGALWARALGYWVAAGTAWIRFRAIYSGGCR